MASIIHTNAFVILSASLLLSFSSIVLWHYGVKIFEAGDTLVSEEHVDKVTIITRECLAVLHNELSDEPFEHVIVSLHYLKEFL